MNFSSLLVLGSAVGSFHQPNPATVHSLQKAKKSNPPISFGNSTDRPVDQELEKAVKAGNAIRVKHLLDKGANPNAKFSNGWTPLLELEGTIPQQISVAKELIAKGANVNYSQPDQGYTPLLKAITYRVHEDQAPLVKLLIEKGAKVNTPLEDGVTPLHLAAAYGQTESVKVLLKYKANVNARTFEVDQQAKAKKQREEMLKNFTREQAEMLNKEEQSDQFADKKMLQDNEAVNARMFEPGFRNTGLTPIMEMVEIGMSSGWNQEIADILIGAGADIKATNDSGWTMLHMATKAGNLPAAKALIHMGLDVNAPSKGGFRPLHIAMRAGYYFPHKELAQLLIQNHADSSLKNNLGQTPLDLLVADSKWFFREEQNNPNAKMGAEMRDRYLAIVNSVVKLLDPKADPVAIPAPTVDIKGTRYKTLEIDGVDFQRAVKIENGKAILELWIEDAVTGSREITLNDFELNHYEPLVDQPIKVKLRRGERIILAFPKEAAIGGAVSVKYSETIDGGRGTGSGHLNEGPSDNFGFSQSPSNNFKGIEISHQLINTTVIFHIDKVTIKGKEQKQLAGLELKVESGKRVPIPGLITPMEGNDCVIYYRYRVWLNKKWKSETMPFR